MEIEKEYTKDARSDISITMSQEEIIKTYVTESANYDESLEIQPLLNKGIEILRKVGGIE